MDELDRRGEQLLAAYRRVDHLDDAHRQRIARRLARSVQRPTPAWVETLPREEPPSRRRPWPWIAAAAAAVALAIGIGVAADRRVAVDREAPSSSAASHGARAAAPGGAASERTPPSTAPSRGDAHGPAAAGSAEDASDPARTNDPARARPGERGSRSARPSEAPAAADEPHEAPSLAAELEALDRAEAALRRDRPAAASEALARYRRAFPQGQLRVEAEGLRAIADCELGRAGAPAEAGRYLEQHPGSALASRIAQACARDGSPAATDSAPREQPPAP